MPHKVVATGGQFQRSLPQGKTYHLEDEHYDRLNTAVGNEGTAVAVRLPLIDEETP